MNIDYSKEFELIAKAYEQAGGNIDNLLDKRFGSLVISGDKVLGKNAIPGFTIKTRKIRNGVSVKLIVEDNTVIKFPIHLCFGMIPKEGTQIIRSTYYIGKNAKVKFLSHCSFPNAKHIVHIMDNTTYLDEGAEMEYEEVHFHSGNGGVEVYPKLRGTIKKNSKLIEKFKLVIGRVGYLNIDYEINQDAYSICELDTKVFGKKDDKIEIREALYLNGEYASGLAKSRIVLKDNAYGNVLGEVQGNAPHTRGHTDCEEILQGEGATAISTPAISVTNPLAKVTHEASIGRIDKKELETLMARGLTEEQAVDLIVKGILK